MSDNDRAIDIRFTEAEPRPGGPLPRALRPPLEASKDISPSGVVLFAEIGDDGSVGPLTICPPSRFRNPESWLRANGRSGLFLVIGSARVVSIGDPPPVRGYRRRRRKGSFVPDRVAKLRRMYPRGDIRDGLPDDVMGIGTTDNEDKKE